MKPAPNSRPVTISVELDGQPWQVRVDPDGATVRSGEPDSGDLTLSTTAHILDDILHHPARLNSALKKRRLRITGDRTVLEKVLARLPDSG